MKLTPTVCELCHDQQPSLYCSSDSAFLCSDCDSHVHAANFLVARHVRLSLCSLCKSFTARHHSSSFPPPFCRSCSTAHDDALSSSSSSSFSSSSACISSNDCSAKTSTPYKTTSGANQVMLDWKTRHVLVNWCTRLDSSSAHVIEVASRAFEVWCLDRSVWPYRVGLAASLWFGLSRFTKKDEKKKMRTLLKRLEEISGVPAKSIAVAGSKLASMLKMMKLRRRYHHHVEEGWAEC